MKRCPAKCNFSCHSVALKRKKKGESRHPVLVRAQRDAVAAGASVSNESKVPSLARNRCTCLGPDAARRRVDFLDVVREEEEVIQQMVLMSLPHCCSEADRFSARRFPRQLGNMNLRQDIFRPCHNAMRTLVSQVSVHPQDTDSFLRCVRLMCVVASVGGHLSHRAHPVCCLLCLSILLCAARTASRVSCLCNPKFGSGARFYEACHSTLAELRPLFQRVWKKVSSLLTVFIVKKHAARGV